MAKMRFPGRPGYRFERTGVIYSVDEARQTTDLTISVVDSIRKGLQRFRDTLGESDDDDAEFLGFTPSEVQAAEEKFYRAVRLEQQILEKEAKKQRDRQEQSKAALASLAAAGIDFTSSSRGIPFSFKKTYNQILKTGLVKQSDLVKTSNVIQESPPTQKRPQSNEIDKSDTTGIRLKRLSCNNDAQQANARRPVGRPKKGIFINGGSSYEKRNGHETLVSTNVSNSKLGCKYASVTKQILARATKQALHTNIHTLSGTNKARQFVLPTKSCRSSRVIKPNKRFLEEDSVHQLVAKQSRTAPPSPVSSFQTPVFGMGVSSEMPVFSAFQSSCGLALSPFSVNREKEFQVFSGAPQPSGASSFTDTLKGQKPLGTLDQPLIIEGKRPRKPSLIMRMKLVEDDPDDEIRLQQLSSDTVSCEKTGFDEPADSSGSVSAPHTLMNSYGSSKSLIAPAKLFTDSLSNRLSKSFRSHLKYQVTNVPCQNTVVLRQAKLHLNRTALNRSKAALARSLKAQLKREAKLERRRCSSQNRLRHLSVSTSSAVSPRSSLSQLSPFSKLASDTAIEKQKSGLFEGIEAGAGSFSPGSFGSPPVTPGSWSLTQPDRTRTGSGRSLSLKEEPLVLSYSPGVKCRCLVCSRWCIVVKNRKLPQVPLCQFCKKFYYFHSYSQPTRKERKKCKGSGQCSIHYSQNVHHHCRSCKLRKFQDILDRCEEAGIGPHHMHSKDDKGYKIKCGKDLLVHSKDTGKINKDSTTEKADNLEVDKHLGFEARKQTINNRKDESRSSRRQRHREELAQQESINKQKLEEVSISTRQRHKSKTGDKSEAELIEKSLISNLKPARENGIDKPLSVDVSHGSDPFNLSPPQTFPSSKTAPVLDRVSKVTSKDLTSPQNNDRVSETDESSDLSHSVSRGPRIKHVCRRAAMVFPHQRATFPESPQERTLTLSALPNEEKQQLLAKTKQENTEDSSSEESEDEVPPPKVLPAVTPDKKVLPQKVVPIPTPDKKVLSQKEEKHQDLRKETSREEKINNMRETQVSKNKLPSPDKIIPLPPVRSNKRRILIKNGSGNRKRKTRCKECKGCKTPECGVCVFCRDKPKFGGPGRIKKCCIHSVCLAPKMPRKVTEAFIDPKTPTKTHRRDDDDQNGDHYTRSHNSGAGIRESDSRCTEKRSNSHLKMQGSQDGAKDAGDGNELLVDVKDVHVSNNKTDCAAAVTSDSCLRVSQSGSDRVMRLTRGRLDASLHLPSLRNPFRRRMTGMWAGRRHRAVGHQKPVAKELKPVQNETAYSQDVCLKTHLIRADLEVLYDIKTAWSYGFAITLTGISFIGALCFLCGSAGKQEMLYCIVCCQPYHTFCLNEDERPEESDEEEVNTGTEENQTAKRDSSKISWCCRRCQFCHVCGQQNGLLKCHRCKDTYHPECLGPNYPTKPSRKNIWVCTKCVRCKSCGATTPGVGTNATWTYDFSLCYDCGKLMDKGNFCPVCHKCYSDDDWDSKMVQCARCESWVHAKCEELTDEMYQLMSCLPDDVQYNCRVCSTEDPPYWRQALKSELVRGFQNVLNALMSSKSAQSLLESVPQRDITMPRFATLPSSDKFQSEGDVSQVSSTSSEESTEPLHTEETTPTKVVIGMEPSHTEETTPTKVVIDTGQCRVPDAQGPHTCEVTRSCPSDGGAKCQYNRSLSVRHEKIIVEKCDCDSVGITSGSSTILTSNDTISVNSSSDSEIVSEKRSITDSPTDSLTKETSKNNNLMLCPDINFAAIAKVAGNSVLANAVAISSTRNNLIKSGGKDFPGLQLLLDLSAKQGNGVNPNLALKVGDLKFSERAESIVGHIKGSNTVLSNCSKDWTSLRKNLKTDPSVVDSFPSLVSLSESAETPFVQSDNLRLKPPHTFLDTTSSNSILLHSETTGADIKNLLGGNNLSLDSRQSSMTDSVMKDARSELTKTVRLIEECDTTHLACQDRTVTSGQSVDRPSSPQPQVVSSTTANLPLWSSGTDHQPENMKDNISPFAITWRDSKRLNTSEHPMDFHSILQKIHTDSYTTVEKFSEDMVRIIQELLFENEPFITRKKQANSVRSIFIKQMERIFPWFNVNTCQLWEHNRMLPAGMLKDAVLPPSDDHTYAQWLERKSSPELTESSPCKVRHSPVKLKNGGDLTNLAAEEREDNRVCLLCQKVGDDEADLAGRLLYCGQDDWVHINCALWSAEVFEQEDGSLINVPEAFSRSKKLRCNLCQQLGATVGCCEAECTANYHFMCARAANCVFQEDKSIFCKQHSGCLHLNRITDGHFAVSTRVFINQDRIRAKSSTGKGVDPASLSIVFGSCTVESLGRLQSSLSDFEECLYPIDFRCARIYWSTQDARKRCVYTCRIVKIDPEFDSPHVQIQDVRIVHDKKHPDYIPLEQLDFERLGIPNLVTATYSECSRNTAGVSERMSLTSSSSAVSMALTSTGSLSFKSAAKNKLQPSQLTGLSPSTLELLGIKNFSHCITSPLQPANMVATLENKYLEQEELGLVQIANRLNNAALSKARRKSAETSVINSLKKKSLNLDSHQSRSQTSSPVNVRSGCPYTSKTNAVCDALDLDAQARIDRLSPDVTVSWANSSKPLPPKAASFLTDRSLPFVTSPNAVCNLTKVRLVEPLSGLKGVSNSRSRDQTSEHWEPLVSVLEATECEDQENLAMESATKSTTCDSNFSADLNSDREQPTVVSSLYDCDISQEINPSILSILESLPAEVLDEDDIKIIVLTEVEDLSEEDLIQVASAVIKESAEEKNILGSESKNELENNRGSDGESAYNNNNEGFSVSRIIQNNENNLSVNVNQYARENTNTAAGSNECNQGESDEMVNNERSSNSHGSSSNSRGRGSVPASVGSSQKNTRGNEDDGDDSSKPRRDELSKKKKDVSCLVTDENTKKKNERAQKDKCMKNISKPLVNLCTKDGCISKSKSDSAISGACNCESAFSDKKILRSTQRSLRTPKGLTSDAKLVENLPDATDEDSDYLMLDDFSYSETNDEDESLSKTEVRTGINDTETKILPGRLLESKQASQNSSHSSKMKSSEKNDKNNTEELAIQKMSSEGIQFKQNEYVCSMLNIRRSIRVTLKKIDQEEYPTSGNRLAQSSHREIVLKPCFVSLVRDDVLKDSQVDQCSKLADNLSSQFGTQTEFSESITIEGSKEITIPEDSIKIPKLEDSSEMTKLEDSSRTTKVEDSSGITKLEDSGEITKLEVSNGITTLENSVDVDPQVLQFVQEDKSKPVGSIEVNVTESIDNLIKAKNTMIKNTLHVHKNQDDDDAVQQSNACTLTKSSEDIICSNDTVGHVNHNILSMPQLGSKRQSKHILNATHELANDFNFPGNAHSQNSAISHRELGVSSLPTSESSIGLSEPLKSSIGLSEPLEDSVIPSLEVTECDSSVVSVEKIVDKPLSNSFPNCSPLKTSPLKCATCKRTYRTRESYMRHVEDCEFELSSSGDDDMIDRGSKGRQLDTDFPLADDCVKSSSSVSSTSCSLHEPLTIIITDEYKDDKLSSASSRDMSDDCASINSQDSKRSLRNSTLTQRNAAPSHLAKARSRGSKASSPDSSSNSLLLPESSFRGANEKTSPKETMLEAVGLVSRRALELSPNSDHDAFSMGQKQMLRLQPRVSPTAMATVSKREKRSPGHAGNMAAVLKPSIMSGGLPKACYSNVKSVSITYDPVVVHEVKLEPIRPKRPRQKRIWWVESSESLQGEAVESKNNEVCDNNSEVVGLEEHEDNGDDEENSVARRTRQKASLDHSPSLRKQASAVPDSPVKKTDGVHEVRSNYLVSPRSCRTLNRADAKEPETCSDRRAHRNNNLNTSSTSVSSQLLSKQIELRTRKLHSDFTQQKLTQKTEKIDVVQNLFEDASNMLPQVKIFDQKEKITSKLNQAIDVTGSDPPDSSLSPLRRGRRSGKMKKLNDHSTELRKDKEALESSECSKSEEARVGFDDNQVLEKRGKLDQFNKKSDQGEASDLDGQEQEVQMSSCQDEEPQELGARRETNEEETQLVQAEEVLQHSLGESLIRSEPDLSVVLHQEKPKMDVEKDVSSKSPILDTTVDIKVNPDAKYSADLLNQSSEVSSIKKNLEQNFSDLGMGSMQFPDITKPPGQKLRFVIRSPNVAAAQTIGELIKRKVEAVHPKTDVLIDSFPDPRGSSLCSQDLQIKGIDPIKVEENTAGPEDTKSVDEASIPSRSASPNSAAYDIQSDDFSSETSNDSDDFTTIIPRGADSQLSVTSLKQANKLVQEDLTVQCPPATSLISARESSSTLAPVSTQPPTPIVPKEDISDDDDVVIMNAVGLPPLESDLSKHFTASSTIQTPSKISLPSHVNDPQQHMPASNANHSPPSSGRTAPFAVSESGRTVSYSPQQSFTLKLNIGSFVNQPQVAPQVRQQMLQQQGQAPLIISEGPGGCFILQQQSNVRQEFQTPHDLCTQGLMLQNPPPGNFIIHAPFQPRLTGAPNAPQQSLVFRPSHSSGFLLSPNNHAASVQGQQPVLQNTAQSGLSFFSFNQTNPLASNFYSPIQSLQSHVNPQSVMQSSSIQALQSHLNSSHSVLQPSSIQSLQSPQQVNPSQQSTFQPSQVQSLQNQMNPQSALQHNLGLASLVQSAGPVSNQQFVISQPFIPQPNMLLPQPVVSLPSEPAEVIHKSPYHSPQPSVTVNSLKSPPVIIDPHAHMLSAGLSHTVLKAATQQFSPYKNRSNTNNLVGQTSLAANIQQQSIVTPANNFSISFGSVASQSNFSMLQQSSLAMPKLTKVDGTPAHVNYMGSFNLNSSTLQSVFSGQNVGQDTTQKIVELVQTAVKNRGKRHIPGVEVKSAIKNTPQGPKKVLRVFINEEVLPGQKLLPAAAQAEVSIKPNSNAAPMFTSSASVSSSQPCNYSSSSSSQRNTDFQSQPLPSRLPDPTLQRPPSSDLWLSSNTGFISVPINPSLTSKTLPQSSVGSKLTPSSHFRRALKSSELCLKRKSSADTIEIPPMKLKMMDHFEMSKNDSIVTGAIQSVVKRQCISDPLLDPVRTDRLIHPQNNSVRTDKPLIHEHSPSLSTSSTIRVQGLESGLPSSHTDTKKPYSLAGPTSRASSSTPSPLNSVTVLSSQTTSSTVSAVDSSSCHQQHCDNREPFTPSNHCPTLHPHLQQPQQQDQRSPHKRASFPVTEKLPPSKVQSYRAKGRPRKQSLLESVIRKEIVQGDDRRSGPGARMSVMSGRLKTNVLASHHPLIHHQKLTAALPQPSLEEEVVATPLGEGKSDHPSGYNTSSSRVRNLSKLRFEISSDDGFSCQGDTLEDAWNQVLEKVQDVRAASRMKQLSYAGISGRTMFGLDHDAVVYLIEQLYGAVHCHRNYKFRFHKYDLDQADEEVALNPSGSARSESFVSRKPFDMFNFLKSVYRTKPGNEEREKEEEMALKSSRRATSLSLPMAMRFRKLKTFAKEAVDVYRSKIHGRGLFCKRNIDAGEMVIEYAGEVIRASLTDKREKYYESKGIGCYMFRIDDDEVVDATMHGSAARFINHSCEPNCFSKVILVDGKKHIVIFAMRPIKRGEELTYDYKFPIEEVKIPCSCGSKRCRKYLN